MRVFSDDVELRECRFTRSEGDSLVLVECSPRIIQCDFHSALQACIRAQGDSPVIEGCTFTNFDVGVNLTDSDATLESCAFDYGGTGVNAKASAVTVANCSFNDMANYCILSSWYSPADATLNSFTDTAYYHEGSTDWWELAVPAGVLIGAAVVALVVVNLGRRERKAPRAVRATSNDY